MPNSGERLGHTLQYILGYIPLVMVAALSAALLLDQNLFGRKLLRTAFFIPVVSAWVAVALLWMWIFNPKFGLLNYLSGIDRYHRTGLALRPQMGDDSDRPDQCLERYRLFYDHVPGRFTKYP